MKKSFILISIFLGLLGQHSLTAQCTSMPSTTTALNNCNYEIAKKYAPRHYQRIEEDGKRGLDGRSDFITAIDFDGNWISDDNWENIGDYEDHPSYLEAHVYYSVTWTSTHWYIIYSYFHPRDWANSWGDGQHENDLEGVLVIVRRSGSSSVSTSSATLEGGVTVFHNDFYSYIVSGSSLTSGNESVDGTFGTWGSTHIKTAQEDEGHGCRSEVDIPNNQDGSVTYYHSYNNTAGAPTTINSFTKYKLVDIFEPGGLWAHRYNSSTFHSWGVFKGDNHGDNKAHAPWRWDDHNDGAVYNGEMATKPANLVNHYYNSTYNISNSYQYHPYNCSYSMSVTPPSSNATNKDYTFTINRSDNIPENNTSINWNYSSSAWQCISGCGSNNKTIILRKKSSAPSGSQTVSAMINTIECGTKQVNKSVWFAPSFNVTSTVIPCNGLFPGVITLNFIGGSPQYTVGTPITIGNLQYLNKTGSNTFLYVGIGQIIFPVTDGTGATVNHIVYVYCEGDPGPVREAQPIAEKMEIKVYPNPFSDHIKLDVTALGGGEIDEISFKLRDALGREVLSQKNVSPQSRIATPSLGPGVYIIELIVDGKKYTRKLIKQ